MLSRVGASSSVMPLRTMSLALVAVVCAGMLGAAPAHAADADLGVPAEEALPELAALVIEDRPAPLEGEIDLDALQATAFNRAEAMPLWAWDIPELAFHLDLDPLRAFEFVRDHIAYEPYHGALRGAEGTLDARAGNALDRALLLSALLDEMLVPHRFAFAELDDEMAGQLVDRAIQGASEPLAPAPTGAVDAIMRRAQRDYALLRQALGPRIERIGRDERPDAIAAAREHIWVQRKFGTEWQDLDPTLPGAVPGGPLASAERVSGAPDAIEPWSVDLEVVVESLEAGSLLETSVLRHRLDPLTAHKSEVFLYLRPQAEGLGGALIDAITGDERWTPVLLVDGEEVVGAPFSIGGRGTDLLGEQTVQADLASVRLEVSVSGPDGEVRRGAHVVIDRVPSDVRASGGPLVPADLERFEEGSAAPLELATFHHVIVSTGSTDLRSYQVRRGLMAGFAATLGDETLAAAYDLDDRLLPLVVGDEGLVVASERVAVPGAASGTRSGRSFIHRPRVFVTSIGPNPVDPETVITSIDLLVDGVRVLSAERASETTAQGQLWYGAVQTAIESEFILRRGDPSETGPIQGVAFSMDQPLSVFEPGWRDGLPAGVAPAMEAAHGSGAILIVPGEATGAETWWTIDPRTGVTRSVLDPGLAGVRQVQDGDRGSRIAEARRIGKPPPGPNRGGMTSGGGRPPLQPPPGGWDRVPGQPAACGSTNEYVTTASCVSLRAAIPAAIMGFTFSFLVSVIAIELLWGW
jgi:Transglutaminase-like superfamily